MWSLRVIIIIVRVSAECQDHYYYSWNLARINYSHTPTLDPFSPLYQLGVEAPVSNSLLPSPLPLLRTWNRSDSFVPTAADNDDDPGATLAWQKWGGWVAGGGAGEESEVVVWSDKPVTPAERWMEHLFGRTNTNSWKFNSDWLGRSSARSARKELLV